MADEADLAQAQVDAFLADAVELARRPHRGPPPVVIDGVTFCAMCSEVIPPARVAAMPGVGLCYTCQQDADEEAGVVR